MKQKRLGPPKFCPIAEELSVLQMIVYGNVTAGYPAEAYNYLEGQIDMNQYILGLKDQEIGVNKEGKPVYKEVVREHIKCVWATNPNMTGQGIELGDLIVVDSTKTPHKDSIILIWLEDEFVLKKTALRSNGKIELISLNGEKPLLFRGDTVTQIGTVTYVLKKFPCANNLYSDYPKDATHFIAHGMDFNKYIIGNNYWETHFYLWTVGNSMSGDGIEKGDLLVVDKLRESYEDSIIVFYIDREFTLKRVEHKDGQIRLVSSNPAMPPLVVRKESELCKWGVLTTVIKKYK